MGQLDSRRGCSTAVAFVEHTDEAVSTRKQEERLLTGWQAGGSIWLLSKCHGLDQVHNTSREPPQNGLRRGTGYFEHGLTFTAEYLPVRNWVSNWP